MKILQICHRVPFPPIDGGNIAMMNLARSLLESGHEVHQFALNTNKHFVSPESLPEIFRKKLHFRESFINTEIRIPAALRNLFGTGSYNVQRFYSPETERKLVDMLKENSFDIVQLETLYTTPYLDAIRRNSKAIIVLRAHNVEHVIWKKLSERIPDPFRKIYVRFLAKRLMQYELGVLNRIDALVPITRMDESTFRNFNINMPVLTIPLGIDLVDYPYQAPATRQLSLFHLGSMDWIPNQEAVIWFLKNCWPKIHFSFPKLRLFLAGRNFPKSIMEGNHPQVFFEGRIEDANEYMSDKQIMIVPLLSGSGMRVKIIQGMALGKTIISTTLGAEGIDCTDGENILIADSPDQFLQQIRNCIDHPTRCLEIGLAGRKLVEDMYSNRILGKRLSDFYFTLLQK